MANEKDKKELANESEKPEEKKGTPIDLKRGPISDIIDLMSELDKLWRRSDLGEINNETAKLHLSIANSIMRGAALNLRYMAIRKFMPGNLPVLRRDQKALQEKPPKPNGSQKDEPDTDDKAA